MPYLKLATKSVTCSADFRASFTAACLFPETCDIPRSSNMPENVSTEQKNRMIEILVLPYGWTQLRLAVAGIISAD